MANLNSSFLLFLSLNLFHIFHTAIARGGERDSGFVDKTYAASGRHLFGENHFQKLNTLAHGYMTNSDLEKAIKAFHGRCGHLSRIYSIGKSVLGVPLWVMEISNNPGKEEAKPAFKFIGNVHGDEPVGRELLLLLANWLCDNYMKNPLATLIVEKVHLHILPSMNPDGFSLRRRGNAKGIDLNRDFPDQFFPMNDDFNKRQPETKAIMKWIKEMRFTASASLHGGALVANYPWDGTEDKSKSYYACPDDEAFRYMAKLYSHSHHNMSRSKEFEEGITNGAHWYPIYGGMQDWNYIYGGCFELTLEISDNKWPPANELRMIWQYNKMSMLDLVASVVKSGVHGRIFSSDCGEPLPANIAIKGINYTIKASEKLADYHRLLVPGQQYEVMAMMPGYKKRTTTIVMGDEPMTVDFILEPDISLSSSFLPNHCSNRSSLKIFKLVSKPHLQVFLTLVLIIAFLCFLMKRKAIVNHFKVRKSVGQRRVSAV
ncbi:carboxypeptidase SOL1 [Cynara cardunculus var. scolymus]|uniref:carboxypeptidase SOL1 n=1 Tax=Cynara cardunculus var. scolymus TaxID=59895 RepID=UPI000D62A2B7|nr:carboxypeptidase SOL1 [Cynara cardunculus var. scolymus]